MSGLAKQIRIKGLLGFAILVLVLALFWLVLVDGIVRRQIERTGTAMVGARVELKGLNLTLFPAGVELTGLKVTDPEHPMKNAVEVQSISFGIDGAKLWGKKVIIEEMKVAGVRFNTERRSSGETVKRVKRSAAKSAEPIRPLISPFPLTRR